MSNLNTKITGLVAAAAIACIFSGARAEAQVTFTIDGMTANAQNMNMSVNGGGSEGTVSGPYTATINGVSNIPVFCVDASHDISFGDSYQANTNYAVTDAAGALTGAAGSQYYAGGLASAIANSSDFGSTFTPGSTSAQISAQAQARADEVAWLAANYINATSFNNGVDDNAGDNSIALTASVWDIVQNGGGEAYAGGSNSFELDTPGYSSLINYYEGLAAQHSTYTNSAVRFIQAPQTNGGHAQDFLYVAAVPEPSMCVTAGALVAMLGLGLVAGRRRRNDDARFTTFA